MFHTFGLMEVNIFLVDFGSSATANNNFSMGNIIGSIESFMSWEEKNLKNIVIEHVNLLTILGFATY